MFILFNPNPRGAFVGDCVIRAICKLTNRSWEDVYMSIAIQGFMMKDMPSANHVWGLTFGVKDIHNIPTL